MRVTKSRLLPFLVLVGVAPLAHSAELDTLNQKFSYVLGYQFTQQMKREGIELDAQAAAAAIEDVTSGAEIKLNLQEMQETLDAARNKLVEQKQMKAQAALEAGQAFLEQNKDKDGVEVLASGLQYQVLQAGEGASPTAESKVTVHYRGTLIDGTEFDSSYKRGEPTSFTLGNVIPGFRESLTRMSKGAKWRVFVPSELGYGAQGAGASIGPNETLIFEIELISFE